MSAVAKLGGNQEEAEQQTRFGAALGAELREELALEQKQRARAEGARSTATPRRGGGRSARDRVSARDREARGTHPAHAAFTHALGSNPASSNASSEMDISAGPTRARRKWRGGRVLERARGARIRVGMTSIHSSLCLPHCLLH